MGKLDRIVLQEAPGTFQRASEEVLKQRKIVRARRSAAPAPAAGAASANPFAGVQLGASSNPFAGIQLAPSAAQPTTDATPANDDAGTEEAAQDDKKPEGEPAKAEEPESAAQPETAASAAATAAESPVKNPLFSGGFGSLASGTQPGSGLSLFGSSITSAGGFGSLGMWRRVGRTAVFGSRCSLL